MNDLACTGKYCRHVVDPGGAIQIAIPGEDEQRLCTPCWMKWCEARETVKEEMK